MYAQSKAKVKVCEPVMNRRDSDSMFKEIQKIPMDQRKALRESYERMLQHPLSCNGLSIFMRMFRDHPEYKDIFKQFRYVHDAHIMGSVELRKHGENYMSTMKRIMDSLEDDKKLGNELKKIAASHKQHGIRSTHLHNMVEAVIESLGELDEGVTDKEKAAWHEIFKCIGVLIEKMQEKM